MMDVEEQTFIYFLVDHPTKEKHEQKTSPPHLLKKTTSRSSGNLSINFSYDLPGWYSAIENYWEGTHA